LGDPKILGGLHIVGVSACFDEFVRLSCALRRSICSALSVPNAMPAMLDELGQAVSPGAHAVVLIDRAGWHLAKDLAVPTNLTPLFLPPYSPELNAIERVWLYLRERFLSHRLWPSYDDILDACCAAWNALVEEAGRIRSLCALDWATVNS
jgi:hypothetical protein